MTGELTEAEIDRLRDVLVEHGSFFGEASVCKHCDMARCPIWVDAYDTLAAAGQLMAHPVQFNGHFPEPSR